MSITVAENIEPEVDVPEIIRGPVDGANCCECPFSKMGNPNQPVRGEGSERPIWIIVGEGPGEVEHRLGVPFAGASGKLVNDALYKIGVKRESVYVTNSQLCKPHGGATEAEKKKARECCSPRLKNELAQFPGRPILALGAHAAQGFCGDKFSIMQMAGAYYQIDVDGTGLRDVIPTIHPAAILRGGGGKGGGGGHTTDLAFINLLYDAQKINQLARGKDIKFTDDVETEATDSTRAEELVLKFIAEARREKYFACDTETYVDNPKQHTALSPINAKMSAIGLATANFGISISWTLLTARLHRLIDAIMADPEIECVFHNRLYDIGVLTQHGFTINGPINCTMLMHHAVFPGLSHNLQRVGTQFFALRPWKAEHRSGQGTIEELLTYNGRDTLVTARIRTPLQIIIKRNQAERLYEVDQAMAKAAGQMHLDGVPISREVNEQLRQGFKANIDKAKADLYAKAFDPGILGRFKERLAFEQSRRIRKHDPLDLDERILKRVADLDSKPFNFMLDAGDHVVAFLRACGVPLSLQTATGRISTKKEVLESFINHPEVSKLLAYRENAKLLSTFVERMFDREYANGKKLYGFTDANSRIHPRWSVHAITGRWKSEGPGCQNWSKADKKKGRPNLRAQVVAPEGSNLVAFDAAQLEARLIALKSGDPFLTAIFKNNRDIHTEFARLVWPDFDQKHVDERKVLRDLVKRPEYCLVPGTRILKRDLTWVPIETLKKGDELIGFSASEPGKPWTENYFKPSTVRATKTLRQPCYRVVTTQGEFIASDEHLWVGQVQWRAEIQPRKSSKRRWLTKGWIRTDKLRPGDRLAFTTKSWDEDALSWDAGYLAGVYDGEGWIKKRTIGFAQNPGPVLTATKALLADRNFNWIETRVGKKDRCIKTQLKGGLWENLRFLGTIKTKRLDLKSDIVWGDCRLRSKGPGAEILAVEYVGQREVVALQTTTETFIAEGFLSHNCSFYAGSAETAWKSVVRDYPNVTMAMIGKMIMLMRTKMPGIAAWHQNEMLKAEREGEVRSMLLGRRRMFPIKQFDLSEVVNYGIQAGGADLINLGLMDIMPKLPVGTFPILQIHDAVVFQTLEDDTDFVKQLVIESFSREVEYEGRTMHFPVDAKSGKSWDIVN